MFPLITDAGDGNLYLHLTAPSPENEDWMVETKVLITKDQAIQLLLTLNLIFVMEAPSVNIPFTGKEHCSLTEEADGRGMGIAELIRLKLGFEAELLGRFAANLSDEEF